MEKEKTGDSSIDPEEERLVIETLSEILGSTFEEMQNAIYLVEGLLYLYMVFMSEKE